MRDNFFSNKSLVQCSRAKSPTSQSFGMWSRVLGYTSTDVSEQSCASIFRVDVFPPTRPQRNTRLSEKKIPDFNIVRFHATNHLKATARAQQMKNAALRANIYGYNFRFLACQQNTFIFCISVNTYRL